MSVDESLETVLARHHVGISGAELVAELDAALSEVAGPAARPLSAVDADFLNAYGGPHARQILTEDPEQATQRLTTMAVRSTTRAVGDTMSIADAAQLLGVDRSRISQLLSSGRLWAFQLGRSRRLPRWQFVGSCRLSGLDTVVPAIPEGLAPQSISGFMKTPQPELDDSSPADWLAGGGDPEVVATLLADLGRW